MLESRWEFSKFQKASDLFRCSHLPRTPHCMCCSGGMTHTTIWTLTTHTLYSCWYYLMWQTCWHSNCSTALNKKKTKQRCVFPIWLLSVLSTDRMQSCFSGICLSLSCAINSVCISLFPLSVNERYTCLWKCTPCNFLSFPGSVRITLSHVN